MSDETTPDDGTAGRDADDSTAGRDADDGVETPKNVWTRWDRTGEGLGVDHGTVPLEDLHLHHYCDVGPLDSSHERALDGTDTDETTYKWFLSGGVLRTGLRQTPAVVLATMLVFVVSAELSSALDGVSAFLPAVDPLVVTGLAVLGGVYLVLVWLLVDVEVLDLENLVRAVVVYGILVALLAGTAASVYLVVTSENPTDLEPNVVYTSGYLLMLFLGGLFVYDGMLRTEHLFLHLPETFVVDDDPDFDSSCDDGRGSDPGRTGDDETGDDDSDRAHEGTSGRRDEKPSDRNDPCPGGSKNRAYHDFVIDLTERLDHSRAWLPVPTAYLFAVLFVTQFAALWVVGVGPQNLDFPVTLVANVVLDLFIVVVAFQFLVLVDALYNLVEGEYDVVDDRNDADAKDSEDAGAEDGTEPDAVRALTYRPFHPDGRGGFRDIGKFATRVNLLLIMAGLYTVYRLYVQGMRVTPAETVSGLPLEAGATVWFVSYVVPILAYGVAAGAWLYYSFWHLHLRMARERERQYTERQRALRTGRGERVGDLEDATDWLEKRNAAPTWPINNRQLASMVSGSVVPLLLSLPNLVL